jgi:maltooligosyltrehalose trehalohydrolase
MSDAEKRIALESDFQLGAVPLPGGGVAFTVWAPFAKTVALVLDQSLDSRQLEPAGSGYHRLVAADLSSGTRYRIALDAGPALPDPASRFQPDGVHGSSEVVDLERHRWADAEYRPRPLTEHVISEVHIGSWSDAGTFDGALGMLDDLVELGISAIELMPVAQFPGVRNWGYDGVFPFAVQCSYGGPYALQRFVDSCHQRGLAVVLDVVYNHVGPEGNVLPAFGPYFTDRYHTPWGPAVNLDGQQSDEVRAYLLQNARQWLENFHFDGLRLDAVHEFVDRTATPFLVDLAREVERISLETGRPRFLVAESADNDPRVTTSIEAGGLGQDAQWNDDFHHALHALVTQERDGYYVDFGRPDQLATAMAQDFILDGEYSIFRQRRHGAPLGDLPFDRFVHFAQNHDQIGNRPGGERLAALVSFECVRVVIAVLLLSPGVPLLFMGDEYGETAPFPYFVDHGDKDLLDAVRRGRNEEFVALGTGPSQFDPTDPATMVAARPDPSVRHKGAHRHLVALWRRLIELRRSNLALQSTERRSSRATAHGSVVTLIRDEPGDPVVAFFNLAGEPGEARLPELGGLATWNRLVDSGDPELGTPSQLRHERVASGERLPLEPWAFCAYQGESMASA